MTIDKVTVDVVKSWGRIETDEEGNDFYSTIDDEAELDAVFEKYLEIAEADE